MTDERPPRRRTSDAPLGERITGVETLVNSWDQRWSEHLRTTERVHADLQKLIGDLDKRADRSEIAMARLLAGLAVVMVLGQILAPSIAAVLGLRN